eukprot:TRINITY_DN7411_c0_g1_i2.p1 TRINITY_DN7411_c0_g1~~TRINITY_DN7411_c0_g1_i2.p1  ORF type:complete len:1376 (+),score=148.73 TRINITY_DN7411_c0_g1_i2:139-4266(+)
MCILRCWLYFAAYAFGEIQPEFDKLGGCGLVQTNGIQLFSHCAPGAWHARFTDTPFTIGNESSLQAQIVLPVTTESYGCTPFSTVFTGQILLLIRGFCSFATKGIHAQNAGAAAFVILDTDDTTTTFLMSIGNSESPMIPGFLLTKAEGYPLWIRLYMNEVVQFYAMWEPLKIWFDLPNTSDEANDTLLISNEGTSTMYWKLLVKQWYSPSPPVYSDTLTPAPPPFQNGGAQGPVTQLSLAGFDGTTVVDDGAASLALPFEFPHYFRGPIGSGKMGYDQLMVSTNGLLSFDSSFVAGSDTSGTLGSGTTPNGFIAAFWDNLVCSQCIITAAEATDSDSEGVRVMAIRFENMYFTDYSDPLIFETWLYSDGRILILVEQAPSFAATLSTLKIGTENADGSQSLSVDVAYLPWSAPPFAVLLEPWLMPRAGFGEAVQPGGNVTLNLEQRRVDGLQAWVYVQVSNVSGNTDESHCIPISQRPFRRFWHLTNWNAGLHDGVCEFEPAQTRSRNRSCVGSDGVIYDDSDCQEVPGGGCSDMQVDWVDSNRNTCEEYLVLGLCTSSQGYGEVWSFNGWGSFTNWVPAGQDGADVVCCACGGGQLGVPSTESDCPSVHCPENSTGVNVVKGCTCLPGFNGTVVRSKVAPYYDEGCTAVLCPDHSSGMDVPSGCTCDFGYDGLISPTSEDPFYSGECVPTTTTTSATATFTTTASTRTFTSTRSTTFTATTSFTLSTTTTTDTMTTATSTLTVTTTTISTSLTSSITRTSSLSSVTSMSSTLTLTSSVSSTATLSSTVTMSSLSTTWTTTRSSLSSTATLSETTFSTTSSQSSTTRATSTSTSSTASSSSHTTTLSWSTLSTTSSLSSTTTLSGSTSSTTSLFSSTTTSSGTTSSTTSTVSSTRTTSSSSLTATLSSTSSSSTVTWTSTTYSLTTSSMTSTTTTFTTDFAEYWLNVAIDCSLCIEAMLSPNATDEFAMAIIGGVSGLIADTVQHPSVKIKVEEGLTCRFDVPASLNVSELQWWVRNEVGADTTECRVVEFDGTGDSSSQFQADRNGLASSEQNESGGRRLSAPVTFAITRKYTFDPSKPRPPISEAASVGAGIASPAAILTNTSGRFANASVSVHVTTDETTDLVKLNDVLQDSAEVTKAIDTVLDKGHCIKVEREITRYRSSEDEKVKHVLYDPESPPPPPISWDPEVRKASAFALISFMAVLLCLCATVTILFCKRKRRDKERYREDGNEMQQESTDADTHVVALEEEAAGHAPLQIKTDAMDEDCPQPPSLEIDEHEVSDWEFVIPGGDEEDEVPAQPRESSHIIPSRMNVDEFCQYSVSVVNYRSGPASVETIEQVQTRSRQDQKELSEALEKQIELMRNGNMELLIAI